MTRRHNNIQRGLTASNEKEIRNFKEINRLKEELAKQRATVAEYNEEVEQSGVLINTYKNAPTAMYASLFHVREVVTNFTNSLTHDFTASANESTQLLREYGIVTTTSGGSKIRPGTGYVVSNTETGTDDAEA